MKIPKNTKIQHFPHFFENEENEENDKNTKNTFFAKNEKTRNIRFSQKCKKSYFLKNEVFEIFKKKWCFFERGILGVF